MKDMPTENLVSTIKMKPEIKKKWLDWLRSGENKQGKEHLKNEDGTYCCLGGLCEIFIQEHNTGLKHNVYEWKLVKGAYEFTIAGIGRSRTYLPDVVVQWAGFESVRNYAQRLHNPGFKGEFGVESFASMNDRDYTFEQIADIIEKVL